MATRPKIANRQAGTAAEHDSASTLIGNNKSAAKSAFQSRLADISTLLVTAKFDDMDSVLHHALKAVAEDYGFERSSLWWLDKERNTSTRSHEWYSGNWTTEALVLPLDQLPVVTSLLLANQKPFRIMDDVPASAVIDRAYYEKRGVKSALITPVASHDKAVGVAVFASLTETKTWSEQSNAEIQLLAQLIGSAWRRHVNERLVRVRERELEKRNQFQKQLAEVSREFSAATYADVEKVLTRTLPKVAGEYGFDRMSLWWFEEGGQIARGNLLYGFDAKHSDEILEMCAKTPWVMSYLLSGNQAPLLYPDDVPTSATADHEYYRGLKVSTCLIVPLSKGKEVIGIAGMATLREHRDWTEQQKGDLCLFGQIVGNTWIRYQDERKIREQKSHLESRVSFQTLLADISSGFLMKSAQKTTAEALNGAIQRFAGNYGIDRVSLWWIAPGDGRAHRVHEWVAAEEYSTDLSVFPSSDAPRINQRILAGDTSPFVFPEDLPEKAADEHAYYAARGLKAGIIVPIMIEGVLAGVVGLAALQHARTWSEQEKSDLLLLVQLISTAWLQREHERRLGDRETDLLRSQRVAKVGSYSFQMQDGSRIVSSQATVHHSAQANAIFGIKDGDECFERLLGLVHPDDRAPLRTTTLRCAHSGGHFMDRDYRIVRDDGRVVHIEDRAELDRDADGEITRVFGTVHDVTERVESQQKLQDAFSEIEALRDQLQAENTLLKEEVRAAKGFESIIGDSEKLKNALVGARKVAPTDVTVLILGETGTGKELVARSIHDLSERRDSTMICVNCAALSSELIESELFGHEAGAFTGAQKQRLGRFELANRGTLFLDEIGDLPMDVQAKLLRVLQSGEFERLGGTRTLKADVRVIAATNRGLREMMDRGEFRADLYFRINNFPIELPALRERREDISSLANHFVRKHSEELGKNIRSISPTMLDHLNGLSWPGNVRELEGYIQRAMISTDGQILDCFEPRQLHERAPVVALAEPPVTDPGGEGVANDLQSMQRRHIRDVLASCNWVIGGDKGAAAALGMPPSSLRSRMKRLGISRPH